MFHYRENSFEDSNDDRQEASNRTAVEISKENEAHTAENKILKEQNKIDEHVRNEYEKKIFDHNVEKKKVLDSEKWNKQLEYREFLLKQIEDKEKHKRDTNASVIQGNSYTYSEELIDPEVKKNLKLTKQKEIKNALDECIRMKNALKLENKQKELEEDRVRLEHWKKRDADEQKNREKVKQQTEINEQRKQDIAKTWKTNKDEEREQFIDTLLKKDTTLSQLNNENSKQITLIEQDIQLENDLLEHLKEENDLLEHLKEENQIAYANLYVEKLNEDQANEVGFQE